MIALTEWISPEWLGLMSLWLVATGALALLFLEGVWKEEGRDAAPAVAIFFLALAIVVDLWLLFSGNAPMGQLFSGAAVADSFALMLRFSVMLAAAIAIFGSVHYLKLEQAVTGEYYALLMLATAGAITMVSATEMVTLFVGLELLSIAGYILAAYFRNRERGIEAGLKYFVMGVFASGFLLFAMALTYGVAGSTFFYDIRAVILSGAVDSLYLGMIAALFLIGFGFKVALVPFHAWAPDVYDGASSPVSAFLSTGIKAAGFAAMSRVFLLFFDTPGIWVEMMIVLAVVTMVVGNLLAFVQSNVKRMLAYSSIAHAGYVLVALAAVPTADPQQLYHAVGFYMIAYTLMTGGAFVFMGWAAARGEGRVHYSDLAGIGSAHPWAAAAMALMMFSLAGFPPTAGFFGKYYIFSLAIENGLVWLVILGVLNSFLSAYYYLRVAVQLFMADESSAATASISRLSPPAVSFAMALLLSVGGTLVFGFLRFPY